ncbi:MAG: phage portal protein [Berryella intestinalis]|uniref:phage portal protein n=1 Tax=Berryella intestinalis TaxID=1531429 RepID=UPI002A5870B6|nr:phage portal protein [Berryella intestinalis]MDD7369714.1 phage portal protein [Berryella intestinalis]MDY3129279.1 phage portal protein [Berryella intestinalis]
MGLFKNLFYPKGDPVAPDPPVIVGHPPGMPPARTPAGYGALMSIDYMACEQTKARSMMSMPAVVIDRSNGERRRLDAHPVAELLNGMANEEMSSAALMAWTTLRRDTFGNAYWFVEWRKGVPVAIWPIKAHVQHSFSSGNPVGFRTRYTVSPGDEHVPAGSYYADEVVNISTAITKDGIKGESIARLAAAELGLSIDLELFYSSMLHNGNHHMGHVEVPEGMMAPDAVDSLKRAIEAKSGIDGAGKAPIFGYGAKWVTDGQTMRDASIIEQQQWVLQQVCRACNVPPWKVYDSTSATYAGGQQARIDYVTDTIVPETRSIEQAMRPVLASCGMPHAQLKLQTQGLMRGDDASRSQYYREMGYLGAYTRADVRAFEDMEPIDGLDKPLFPLNYGTVNGDGTVNVFAAPRQPGDGSQTGVKE